MAITFPSEAERVAFDAGMDDLVRGERESADDLNPLPLVVKRVRNNDDRGITDTPSAVGSIVTLVVRNRTRLMSLDRTNKVHLFLNERHR